MAPEASAMPARLRALIGLCRLPFRTGARRLFNLAYPNDARAARRWSGIVSRTDGMLMAGGTVGHLEREILLSGEWEPFVTRIIERVLGPGDCAVDAGANIGCHTLTMSRCVGRTGRVLAIEPNPKVTGALRENLRLNGIENVEMATVAVSDAAGRAVVRAPAEADELASNQGLSSLEALDTPAECTDVEVATIDELVERTSMRPIALVKIDVQGFDAKVVRGMRGLLERDRPVVVLEYEDWAWKRCGESLAFLAAWMRQFGYSLHPGRLAADGPRLEPPRETVPAHTDLVALHSSSNRGLSGYVK
jgi:FkbM family methyltransferase